MKSRWIIINLFFLILIASFGIASADTIYDEVIYKGDGYQINNYFIEVTGITSFDSSLLLEINIYQLKSSTSYDKLTVTTNIDEGGRRRFKYASGGVEITVQEKNLTSQKATVDITTSGFIIEYEKAVSGGVTNAQYTGKPNLVLTKTVDKSSVEVGDIIRVTIKARNNGNGAAKRIIIDRGITPDFTPKSDIYTTYPSELAADNREVEMMIFEIQATKSGTFNLNPATVTYSSSIFDEGYTSTSNRPVVTVSAEAVETADLQLSITADKSRLKSGEKISFTLNVNNLNNVPARSVKIEPVLPRNISYVSGSSEFSVVGKKPIIQEGVFDGRFEKDYKFTCKVNEVGTYNMTVKLNYYNGTGDISEEIISGMFYVEEGRFDFLKQYPLYVYLTPIVIFFAIAGWVFWRSKQFRM